MAKYDDLELAIEFVSAGAFTGNEAYLCRESGVIYWHSELADDEEELPDDIDSDKFIAIPHKNDLELGKPLILRFTREVLPEKEPEVQEIFGHRGAHARFKNMLEHCGKLQRQHGRP